jgi:LPS export ABC transporter protein LptC
LYETPPNRNSESRFVLNIVLSKLKLKKTSLILLLVILLAIGTVAAVFIGYRQVSNAPEMLLSSIKDGANLSLGKIKQTATRDGRKEWSLEAGSAHYIETEKKAVLKDLFITYFLEDNQKVYLDADQGILNTATNDIEFSGNVVVRNENYRLRTDRLSYEHNRRLIFTDDRVHIAGDGADIFADSLKYDLKANQIVLIGNVATRISGDFRPLGEFNKR